MVKVSVLVPIYNVEKFLPECLDSLCAQTLDDMEIICLNDGSTDNSPNIIKEYAARDQRIKVVNKANSGYGDSMNRGLKEAQGEYIGIVESDDFIEKKAFEELYALAKKTDADVVRSNYYYYSARQNEKHRSVKKQELETPLKISDDFNILYEEPAIWSGLYRRKYLEQNKIGFLSTPGASYQDTGFNFKALAMADHVVYTDKYYLHYRTDNANSSVKSLEKVNFIVKEYAEIEKYLKKNNVSQGILEVEQANKFGAYHWNLQRLEGQLALDFCATIKQEFKKAKRAKLLNKEVFPSKYWTALQIILKFPPRVYVSVLNARKKIRH